MPSLLLGYICALCQVSALLSFALFIFLRSLLLACGTMEATNKSKLIGGHSARFFLPFFARFPFVLDTFTPLPLFPYASRFIRPLFALYFDFNLYC